MERMHRLWYNPKMWLYFIELEKYISSMSNYCLSRQNSKQTTKQTQSEGFEYFFFPSSFLVERLYCAMRSRSCRLNEFDTYGYVLKTAVISYFSSFYVNHHLHCTCCLCSLSPWKIDRFDKPSPKINEFGRTCTRGAFDFLCLLLDQLCHLSQPTLSK